MTDSTPDFVKSASAFDKHGDDTLPLRVFADPGKRRLPFHTKAALWVSASLLAEEAEPNPLHVDRIKTAAILFGIDAEVDAILSRQKVASDGTMVKYAYVYTDPNGVTQRHLPLRNSLEILTAARYLEQHLSAFQLADRQKIASAILTAAEPYKGFTDAQAHFLQKQAGQGECTSQDLREALEERARFLSGAAAASLQKMAGMATKRVDRDTRQQIAAALDGIDREHGLVRLYGNGLERPEDVLFGITKAAIAMTRGKYVRLVDGSVFEKQAIARIPEDQLRAWMGDEMVDDLSEIAGVDQEKLAEVLAILPRSNAKRFAQCAQSCGIAPAKV